MQELEHKVQESTERAEKAEKQVSLLTLSVFKAIPRDVMGKENFYFSLFFIIHLCNDPCCHHILSPQCIHVGYFA